MRSHNNLKIVVGSFKIPGNEVAMVFKKPRIFVDLVKLANFYLLVLNSCTFNRLNCFIWVNFVRSTNFRFSLDIAFSYTKNMVKLFQEIYLWYFVNFRASRL